MTRFPNLPEGVPLQADIEIDPAAGRVLVDLRDNPDATQTGLNLSESTAINSGVAAVLCVVNSKREAKNTLVPNNAGTFRRIQVLVRENCIVGIPRHPTSCSVATNTVSDRVIGMIEAAFAQLADGIGLAEPCWGSPPFQGVVSGLDRKRGEPFVLQLFSGTAGGPATFESDGWLTFLLSNGNGLSYIDETEVVEQKYPFVTWEVRVRPDSEGAGRTRGAPGSISTFGPVPGEEAIWVHYFLDGRVNSPKGVRGGGGSYGPDALLRHQDGSLEELPNVVGEQTVGPGQSIVSLSAGGGGYGHPHLRDPRAVLTDVVEGYISVARAQAAYGVSLTGDPAKVETLRIDEAATTTLRA